MAAARARFAQDGYAGTTIQKIAAVMSVTPTALTRFARAFSGPEHQIGERVTRAFLDMWEGDPRDSEPLLAMLRGAIANEQAATQFREFIEARLLLGIRPDGANLGGARLVAARRQAVGASPDGP